MTKRFEPAPTWANPLVAPSVPEPYPHHPVHPRTGKVQLADLRKLHPAGHYPDVPDKAALELATALHEVNSSEAAVSWAAQEAAQDYFNKYGLAATLDETFRLRTLPAKAPATAVMPAVRILRDRDAENPRAEDGGTLGPAAVLLGRMYCWHKQYTMGDEQPGDDPITWMEDHKDQFAVVLPVYMYDHGARTLSTSPFNDRFDSGQLGWITARRQDILHWASKKTLTKKLIERATAVLEHEVRTYSAYLEGDVWGYEVSIGDEVVDSCWGFYGDALADIKDTIQSEYVGLVDAAWQERRSW